jgi:glutathione S-transferase
MGWYPQVILPRSVVYAVGQVGTIAWGKEKAQGWLAILDKDVIGSTRKFSCGNSVTLADYVGTELVAWSSSFTAPTWTIQTCGAGSVT